MENDKLKKSALDDLENREYQEPKNESIDKGPIAAGIQVKPTSLGKAGGYNTEDDEFGFAPGYLEIYSENFPTKGIFYAKDARFLIRAASVNEIKQFSTMNEEDPYSVDEALNQILKSCLTFREGSSMRSFKDLKEEDRIYVILAIRELTFVKGENKLSITSICKDCGHENHIDITKDSFEANEPSEKLMRYYNEETRRFDVQTKSNGVVSIQAPSVGIMMEVTKYMQKVQIEGKKLDRAFVKTLPYMVTDWRGLNEKTISNLQMDFMGWDAKQFQIMNALIEMCTVGVKETLTTFCENTKCQVEVTTPITFPNGIKSIFVISDIDSELL
jgi:hypothetical protein